MTTIQLDLPEEVTRRLDEVAQYAGQSREAVILEAVEAHLAEIAAEDERIDEAFAQAERGEVVDADEAFAEAEAMLLARGVTPAQLAAMRKEAEAEADAFYGGSSCG